ncbi:MAG: GTP-binding protein [Acidobacteria bacterium]|nr:GTP-binding protein [Acidobacteriota bacterium]
MIQKKICILGAFAVGKTSLVRRFIEDGFDEKYLTTVGVQIKKRAVTVNNVEVNLIIWDLAGEDEFQKVQLSYLRGASGYFLVADGTRPTTLDTAKILRQRVTDTIGAVPFILLINKQDVRDDWDLDDRALAEFAQAGCTIIETSAKTGLGVADAFQQLAEKIL